MEYQKALQIIRTKLDHHTPARLNIPHFIPAAVIIPVFAINHEAHILFTLRTEEVEHHKGQVSFPGGAREQQDSSLEETALRETYEEVGISANIINIIGQLDDFPTISDFLVTPFVATIPYPYPQRINTAEVAEILEVPLEVFLTNQHFQLKEKEYAGNKYPVYYYHYRHAVIWGITAFILNRFIEMAFDYNPAPGSVLSDPRTEKYRLDNIRKRGFKR